MLGLEEVTLKWIWWFYIPQVLLWKLNQGVTMRTETNGGFGTVQCCCLHYNYGKTCRMQVTSLIQVMRVSFQHSYGARVRIPVNDKAVRQHNEHSPCLSAYYV